jgi:hypothetical protein
MQHLVTLLCTKLITASGFDCLFARPGAVLFHAVTACAYQVYVCASYPRTPLLR